METNQEFFQLWGLSLFPKLTKRVEKINEGKGTVWNAIANAPRY